MTSANPSTALVTTSQSPTLSRVSNQLMLTSKLLGKFRANQKITLANADSYKLRRSLLHEVEDFVKTNFWHFLNAIIMKAKQTRSRDLDSVIHFHSRRIELIEKFKFAYEYPSVPYRARGGGYYKELDNLSNLYSPKKLTLNMHGIIMEMVDEEVIGHFLSDFEGTSVSKAISCKIVFKNSKIN